MDLLYVKYLPTHMMDGLFDSRADMYKSQLQELAQRSCFNLPSYACIREGPDHAPRFKASVNFNGEIFESPSYRTTLRKAEHAAAEVALNVLSTRGPSRSLTARILDETGVYKNLLQETAHRTGLNLPVYTTVRSGPGHVPVFTSTVELAGMNFTGESAKTKKQAEKNAAIAAWSALKKMPNLGSVSQTTSKETDNHEHHQDEAVVARVLSNFRLKDEKKPIRRRDDQNQTRRGIMNWGHSRDNGLNTCLQNHLWRPMDLLMDSFSEGPKQKQKSFVSLLPPPPPRTTSKILQTTSSSSDSSSFYQYSTDNRPSNMIQLTGQYSQVKMQEVPPPSPPLDEHQKDEDEWLSGKSDDVMIKKPLFSVEEEDSELQGANCMYRPFALANNNNNNNNTGRHNTLAPHQYTTQNEQSHMRSRLVGPPMAVSSIKTPTRHHMGRTVHIGGYNPQRIAPAVHIRSVIPVCATPSSQPAVRPQQPSMKELGVSASTTTPLSTHTAAGGGGGGAEVSSATTPTLFNKLLQVNKTQLSSEFNNKLQL